jgi:hypothetical protein
LSQALDLVDAHRQLTPATRRALAFGRVSAEDAAVFCAMAESQIKDLPDARHCVLDPALIPDDLGARWFLINRLRGMVRDRLLGEVTAEQINQFLNCMPPEFRFALFIDLVEQWGELGAEESMLSALREVLGT